MSWPPGASFLRGAGGIIASAAAVVSLGAQSAAGTRYEFTTSSHPGELSRGTAYVLADTSRIEMPNSDGEFIVTQPGHLFSVHPDKREYSDSPPDALANIIGTTLRATRLIVRFELDDIEVVAQDLGEGDAVAGQATRHYRLVQRFSVTVHPLIVGSTNEPPEKHEVVTDYWVGKNIRLPRNPLVDLLSTAPSAVALQDEGFVKRTAAVRDSLFTGMPLKVQVTTRKNGEHAELAEKFEVTSITRGPISHTLFEIPPGYRRTDGFSMPSM